MKLKLFHRLWFWLYSCFYRHKFVQAPLWTGNTIQQRSSAAEIKVAMIKTTEHKTLPAVWETALMKLKGSTEQPFQNRNLFVFLLTATASYRCCHDVTHTHTQMRGGFSQCKWITGQNCCISEHRKGLRWSSIFCFFFSPHIHTFHPSWVWFIKSMRVIKHMQVPKNIYFAGLLWRLSSY